MQSWLEWTGPGQAGLCRAGLWRSAHCQAGPWRTAHRRTALAALAAFTTLAWPPPAAAQDYDAAEVEEVLTTGSYIRGTPENAPNPVTLLTREELLDQGSPTIVEMVKGLGVSSGADGDSNQFQSRFLEGAANINLRGLGPGRTLVLMNGKRIAYSGVSVAQMGYQQFVNLNNIPVVALERVEVLRDGASSTYGSDAVGGVANFLTRDRFTGVELSFGHKLVQDSDGWTDLGLVWGADLGEASHLLLALGYNNRSELQLSARDYTLRSFAENPQGGWSGTGNPGRYSLVHEDDMMQRFTARFNDPDCSNFSGVTDPDNACRFQYVWYDNFVQDETRVQLYAEYDLTFAGGSALEISALVANVDVPNWKTSPSYPPASSAQLNRVPAFHPGLVRMVEDVNGMTDNAYATCPSDGTSSALGGVPVWATGGEARAACVLQMEATRGLQSWGLQVTGTGDSKVVRQRVHPDGGSLEGEEDANILFSGRYLAWGAAEPGLGTRSYDTMNLTFDYGFDLAGGAVEAAVRGSYGSQTAETLDADMLIQRFTLALRGYGGAGCIGRDDTADLAAALGDTPVRTLPSGSKAAGQGACMWYNPFSNALPRAGRGTALYASQDNPHHDADESAQLANRPDLLRWLWEDIRNEYTTTLLTLEAIFSGSFGADGQHGWAAGAQLRQDGYQASYHGFADRSAYPCNNEFVRDASQCPRDFGVYAYLASADPFDRSETVIAGFGEAVLDLGALQLQASARFESYSDAGASALSPKLSLRWDVGGGLSLRGSLGQSFKAPQLAQTTLRQSTVVSPVSQIGTFKAISTSTTPDGLEPEDATNLNLGLIYQAGGFFAALDYWTLEMNKPIVTESFSAVLDQVCTDHDDDATTNRQCDRANNRELAGRIHINGATLDTYSTAQELTSDSLNRIEVHLINGDSLTTGGLDLTLRYSFDSLANPMSVALEWSHLASYELAAALNGTGVAVAQDHVGQLNAEDSPVRPLPADKLRASWSMDINALRLRVDLNHIGSYEDERTGIFESNPNFKTIEAQTTLDFHASHRLNGDRTRVYLNLDNLLDQAPPAARLDMNYDTYTHGPLGATLKVGFVHNF